MTGRAFAEVSQRPSHRLCRRQHCRSRSQPRQSRDHPDRGECEVADTAVPQIRVTLMVGNKPNGTRVEMKKLLATIALLCLSSTVLAHDIYSNLRDRAGHLCCNGQDCRPVQATVLPDGNYYLPTTGE